MMLSGPIELIKQSIQIFFKKQNLSYFLKIYALLLPFAIFFLIQDYFLGSVTSNLTLTEITNFTTTYGWLFWVSLPVGLAYLVISFWVSASGIKAVANVVAGSTLDIRDTLKFAWKKLWIFSLLSIVVGLVIGLGFVLLIIPGLIFLVWYRFSSFEFMTKGAGIGAAMGESKKLVSGKFFPVLGRMIVFGIFGILAQVVFGLIPQGLGGLIQPFFGGLFILPYFLLYKELSG